MSFKDIITAGISVSIGYMFICDLLKIEYIPDSDIIDCVMEQRNAELLVYGEYIQ